MPSYESSRSGGAKALTVLVLVVLTFVGVIGTVVSGFDKTDSGKVGVVRNGGLFDKKTVRQVVPSASSLTWTGIGSKMHEYPSQERYYTITADANRGDRPGVDVVRTPSSDGVDMGLEATIYFTLNTDLTHCQGTNTKDLQVADSKCPIAAFDNKFGTRQFPGFDNKPRNAWDGDEGWSAFLDAIVRPVIINGFRTEVNNFRCAELISSCALLQNVGATVKPATDTKDTPTPATASGQANNTNLTKVQTAVQTSLTTNLQTTLGGSFFTNIRVNLSRVSLPDQVQKAVNDAQAAYAKVSEAQAKVATADAEAQANIRRQQGYNACPACAQIDTMKAIPPNVTVFAPGTGFAVTQPATPPQQK